MVRLLNSGMRAHGPRRYVRPSQRPSEVKQPNGGATTPPESEETSTEVPDGLSRVVDLLEWVGDDPDRAEAVLQLEKSKPEEHQRKTLVQQLTEVILEA